MEHVIDNSADIAFLTETWLKSQKNAVTAAVQHYNYKLYHCNRTGRSKEIGGGVGILVKVGPRVKPVFFIYETTWQDLFKASHKTCQP